MAASDLHLTSTRQPDDFTRVIEFTPAIRTLIADAVEALILLLDAIDGDADLDDGPDQRGYGEREQDQAFGHVGPTAFKLCAKNRPPHRVGAGQLAVAELSRPNL